LYLEIRDRQKDERACRLLVLEGMHGRLTQKFRTLEVSDQLRDARRVYSGLIRCNEDMLQCCYANCFKLNMTVLSLNIIDGVMRREESQSPQNKQKRHSIISRLYLPIYGSLRATVSNSHDVASDVKLTL
jgi:hypothetical protein